MKYSTFMMPLHPPGRNIVETLKEDQDAIILADQLGFSEAYVGEHVTDAAETVTSSMIFLANDHLEASELSINKELSCGLSLKARYTSYQRSKSVF